MAGSPANIKDYWLHGKGLARWTTWTQLYNHMKKHVSDRFAKQIAASWFHERYGRWPAEGRTADGRPMDDEPTLPPASFFEKPDLPKGSGPVITAEGRYMARVGEFDIPHIGLDGDVVMPRSTSDYRYFKTGGGVLTSDGAVVPTGRITLGTGHPGVYDGMTAAAEHYDNTGTAVADVAIGEDEHGVWVSGAVRPGTTPEQLHALRASPLSGDWRPIDGEYELVAALAVNTPGFPIVPEATPALAASGRRPALVAVGIVQHQQPPSGETKRSEDVAEPTDPTTEPTPAPAATDDLAAVLRAELGLDDDVDQEQLIAAFRDHFSRPGTPAEVPGTVLVDEQKYAALQASAAKGEQAYTRQQQEDREALVASAVADGRIAPARREHWLAQLQADPGAQAILASLAPGLIPVDGARGHSVDPAPDPGAADDYWFPGVVSTSTSREG